MKDRTVKLWDDIPSNVRIGKLSQLIHGNELDPRPLLLGLPVEAGTPSESEDYLRFFQEEDLVCLQSEKWMEGSRSVGIPTPIAATKFMLQMWINADPANHTRLPLFNAVHRVFSCKVDLACQCLANADEKANQYRPGKRRNKADIKQVFFRLIDDFHKHSFDRDSFSY